MLKREIVAHVCAVGAAEIIGKRFDLPLVFNTLVNRIVSNGVNDKFNIETN